MMNTMHITGFGPFMGVFHVLAVVLFIVGVIFLVHWSLKTLHQKQLKTWGIVFVAIGLIVSIVTLAGKSGLGGCPCCGMGKSQSGMQCMQMKMDMMDDDMMKGGMMDDDMMEGMDHSMMKMDMDDDAMSMSMHDMAAMLKGKTGDDFDKAFLQGMIPHHQGAIDMAVAAKTSAKHEEIKRMADAIISAQQQEIDQMNQWMQDWGYTE